MSEQLDQAIAVEVRRLAEQAGLSGRELARRTGVAPNTLAVKLRGGTAFTVGELADVANALGTDAATVTAAAQRSASRARSET